MNRAHSPSRLPVAGRLFVALLIAMALWNPHWRPALLPVDVIVVLDESRSMGARRIDAAWQEAAGAISRLPAGSAYSLIRFGAAPVLEVSGVPVLTLADDAERPRQAAVDASGSNIDAALRLAAERSGRGARTPVVLITDGGETNGDATALLERFGALGLPAPFLFLDTPGMPGPDAAIVRFDVPGRVPAGATVPAVISVSATHAGPVDILLSRESRTVHTRSMDLAAGQETYLSLPLEFDVPGFHQLTIEVRRDGDANPANDRRRGIVNVVGPTPVHFVSNRPRSPVAESLRAGGWDVESTRPERLAQVLPRLTGRSVVILDDVAVGEASEQAWRQLAEAVRGRGTGLIVLGGVRSFGAGGYLDSTLESVLPVISRAGAPLPRAAVMFVVDKSGSMGQARGDVTPFDTARKAVLGATRLLGEQDQVGVVVFDIEPRVRLPLARHENPAARMGETWQDVPSGGTRLAPALTAASEALATADAEQRLLVLVTDGFAAEDDYSEVLENIEAHEIDVIALAIGEEPEIDTLQELASRNEGMLIRVGDLVALPRLVSESVGARRLTYEAAAVRPRKERELPFIDGSDAPWPYVDGYQVTRERADARVYLRSERGDPLLADHDAGLGRVAALPAGLGVDTPAWLQWSGWAPFLAGLVEWVGNGMGAERIHLSVDDGSGRPRLVIDAIDADGDWVSSETARVVLGDPFGRETVLEAEPLAPGRLGVELPLRQPGRHRISARLGPLSANHEFIHDSPDEMDAVSAGGARRSDWLEMKLVTPWHAGDEAPISGAVASVPSRPLFVLAAAVLYLGIVIWEQLARSGARPAAIFQRRRHDRKA